MLNLKVAFGQTNPVVGALNHNLDHIKKMIAEAHLAKVDLLIFGELALCGYPLGDLSYRRDVIARTELALQALIAITAGDEYMGPVVVLGHVSRATILAPKIQRSLATAHNTASVFGQGKLIGTYHKHLLPNYDVFDDWRNFVPGQQELVFTLKGHKVAVMICEDIWGDSDRSEGLKASGVELVVVPNGSPYSRTKRIERRDAAIRFASGMDLAYANLAGGQDELVFDGDSFYISDSSEIFRADSSPGLYLVSESRPAPLEPKDLPKLYEILVTGLRDYLSKTNQVSCVLGVSGGIDSALCAAIAVDAVGSENVVGVALPSRYSSEHSIADAKKLCQNLGIEYREIPIEPAHAAFEAMLELSDLAAENIQARIRAVLLMGISNTQGQLLLSTGNKSEIAVGYSTMYGDAAGGFAPIKDVYKTDVWQLAEYLNSTRDHEVIPQNSITKPPSAELKPDQFDSDSLPDYKELDQILELLIEQANSAGAVIAQGFKSETVHKIDAMVRSAEWKRSQGAIGTKTTKVAFGLGRKVPITTRFEDL
ncbi:NAD+ synthase (glutamine-hydrolysing) [Candidatus Aquiluna sp. UB-MaderosW2red]|nr:NAD+ synthase [Candidatus Aquiluna sp. UB-MaderosW2red]SCX11007.1 NAD+ synthase (glutamine-hydrolysing) [Candidatus Aquiluna sp. UB-MaderosW2red]